VVFMMITPFLHARHHKPQRVPRSVHTGIWPIRN